MHFFEDVFLHNRRGVGGLGLGLGRMRFGQFVRTAWRRLGGELGVQVRLWVGVWRSAGARGWAWTGAALNVADHLAWRCGLELGAWGWGA